MNFPPPTERQARLIWLAVSGLSIAALVALLAGAIWGLGKVLDALSPVLWPLAAAGVLAYLLDPVVDRLEVRGVSRPRAILCVFALALLLMGALLGSVVPQVINESRQLIARVPAYAMQLERRMTKWVEHPPRLLRSFFQHETTTAPASHPANTNEAGSNTMSAQLTPQSPSPAGATLAGSPFPSGTLETATGWLASAMPRIGSWLLGQFGRVASWIGVLAGLAMIPVYTFYFLLEKQGISSRWTDYLPVSDSMFKQELVFVLNSINNYLIAFFRGQVLVALCDGILYGVGFLLIGLPYALLIGVMAVFLTMIPFLGAITTCVTALLIAVVQYGDWGHPLLVIAVFGCVQALEGLVISPKIMGGRVGLHPVTIIIAVMAGTTLLGGLLGGILAIPLTAALRVVMFRYIWKPASTSAVHSTSPGKPARSA